jgi:flavin reductase (DIM6/NTAB) family NADH-FMN oxidoreductase RutF
MRQTDINVLMKEDVWRLIGQEWMLITAGNIDDFNTMTASWGGVGWLWNKPVAFLFIRPERHTHGFVENNDSLTLSFLPEQYREALRLCGTLSGRDCNKVEKAGLTPLKLNSVSHVSFEESRLCLVCKKLFKIPMTEEAFIDKDVLARWYNSNPGGSLHDIYVVEILEAWNKE